MVFRFNPFRLQTSFARASSLEFNELPIIFERHSGKIGWGTLSLINGGLAESKGRNKWNWIFLSFALGPLATAFIVFTKNNFKHQDHRSK